MGKKRFILPFILAAALSTVAAAGCGSHEHNYTEYGKDGARHWKYCAEDGKISLNSYEAHSFGANNACVCGATFSSELSIDESRVTTRALKNGEINHDGINIYATLYYPTVKKSTYPTVIMSHGFNNYSDTFTTLATDIAKQGYLVCTFDFYGGSERTRSGGTLLDMSVLTEYSDLCAVMDYMKGLEFVDNDNLFLFGQSHGGYVSSYTAAKRKDDVKGLMLYFPGIGIETGYTAEEAEALPEGRIDYMTAYVSKKYFIDDCKVDIFKEIHSFDKEVIICHGDSDKIVPIGYSERAVNPKEGFPHATLHVIEGADHRFKDNPQYVKQTNALIFEYLARNICK